MSEDKLKKAYRASEDIYDDVLTQNSWFGKLYIGIFWGIDDNQIAEQVLSFIPDNFSGKLLDVPVGTAVFTHQKYAELERAKITCVDYSEVMIEKAKARFADLKNSNIVCQQGDVGNLEFADQTFDIVLTMNGLHVFPDKEKAFSETARVLKKGGSFIGCMYIKGEYKRSDFVVNAVLAKKGWFTAPFQTKSELQAILESYYSDVQLYSDKAMAWFKCIK